MGFRVPSFNLTARVWSRVNVPAGPINPGTLGPHRIDVACQLRAAGKLSTAQDAGTFWNFAWELLVAAGTDLRDSFNNGGPDMIECPQGSQRWYTATLIDDVAKGFANEYRVAFIFKNPPWPIPIP